MAFFLITRGTTAWLFGQYCSIWKSAYDHRATTVAEPVSAYLHEDVPMNPVTGRAYGPRWAYQCFLVAMLSWNVSVHLALLISS